ncbi:MAG TPA: acyltransferase family protein [Bryobacteraceae bacterium]|nr:acyltransferase family protein [Bryobacteraceae bacterium]
MTVAPAPPTASVQYRPAIDGLRAVAVLSVFLFHLNRRWLPGGFVGVDIFFVISGYLITSILLREYERNHFTLGKFYQRRIARLFPAFFTVALTTLIGASFIYSPQDLASAGANLTSAVLSVANMKYMWQGNYFTISPDAQPFLHYWSLSVEEQFYMLFPVFFFFLYLKANRYRTTALAILCGISLAACIQLTHTRPQWAFFLLPTRAWELLAGSILANHSANRPPSSDRKLLWTSVSLGGLALVAISLVAINEGAAFPGYLAALPVLGTVCLLAPGNGSVGLSERLLSWAPAVLIGRMSYSLYLWHWPVFSLVDYKFYLASPFVRIVLKVVLTLAATTLCFFLIENPGRVFFNDPRRRRTAFAFFAVALLFFVPLGISVRKANYVNAERDDISKGGLLFDQSGKNGSIVLMGDSNGSMYGKMMKNIAYERGLKLDVISMAAGDPLPRPSGEQTPLWLDSFAVVKRVKPDFLVLVCSWQGKLNGDKSRLDMAIRELKPYVHRFILITQPPMLPKAADRESMRNGSRPPFQEDPVERAARLESNALVKNARGDNVVVIDIEPLFSTEDGIVRFADRNGNEFYNDSGHLSDSGAGLVKPRVLNALAGREPD